MVKRQKKISPSSRLSSRLGQFCALLHSYPTISFCHVRREANKAVDLVENAGVEGRLGFRCDTLEDFGVEEWAQHCRHLVSRDVNSEAHMACLEDGRTDGGTRFKHGYTRPT